jgi:hypothetical protein
MTDQTNSGTPTDAGGSKPADNASGSFMRSRTAQMAETMQPAQGAQPAQPEANEQQQPQQQQTPSAEKVYGEHTAAEIDAAFAFKAEADIRKSGLPSTVEAYEAKLSPSFQPPVDGARFEIDAKSPALANVRKVALKHGLSQEAFSDLLDVYAADKIGEQAGALRAREINLQQLGAAGVQRISAVGQWLNAIAGKDGAAVAVFITKFPSAPIVRSLETVIRRFSSQGSVDFSQSHRATQEDPGKIPGYENMTMVQRRVAQMQLAQNRPGYRSGGSRNER